RIIAADPDDNQARYNVACTYAYLGEADKAIELIEAWLQHVTHDSEMWIVNDPDFDPIKDHPRFRAIVDRLGLSAPPDDQKPRA
ncbi:MAG: TPR end-of-group domain-containing protein, partial [Albidovulum sp.]